MTGKKKADLIENNLMSYYIPIVFDSKQLPVTVEDIADIFYGLSGTDSFQWFENNIGKYTEIKIINETATPTPKPTVTLSSTATPVPTPISSKALDEEKETALLHAKGLFNDAPFSHFGLAEFLVDFCGYSEEAAEYAADNCGEDWYIM